MTWTCSHEMTGTGTGLGCKYMNDEIAQVSIFWPFPRAVPESSKDWDFGTGSLVRQQCWTPTATRPRRGIHMVLQECSIWFLWIQGWTVLILRPQPGTIQMVTVQLWDFSLSCSSCHAQGQCRLPANLALRQPHLDHRQTLLSLFTSQPFISSCLYLLISTSVSSQINNFKLLFPTRHQIWYFWFCYLSDVIYLIEFHGFGSNTRLSFPEGL